MNKPMMIVIAFLIAGTGESAWSQGYAPWYYGGGGEVGTVYSAEQNAIANTIRAQGEYNQMQAAAMSNFEDARSKYIDNHEKWTQVYYERKRANEAQRAQDRAAALAARQRAQNFTAARRASAPTNLAESLLDEATGQIHWPAALTAPTYEEPRKKLDGLFELRAHTSTTPDLAAQVDTAVRTMKDLLRAKIREMPTQEYIEARKFLDNLTAITRSPVK